MLRGVYKCLFNRLGNISYNTKINYCVSVCPKGLNPTRAIGHIKQMLISQGT